MTSEFLHWHKCTKLGAAPSFNHWGQGLTWWGLVLSCCCWVQPFWALLEGCRYCISSYVTCSSFLTISWRGKSFSSNLSTIPFVLLVASWKSKFWWQLLSPPSVTIPPLCSLTMHHQLQFISEYIWKYCIYPGRSPCRLFKHNQYWLCPHSSMVLAFTQTVRINSSEYLTTNFPSWWSWS